MSSPETDPQVPTELVQTCLNCAALVDVSEQDPFDVVHCPMCGTAMRVERRFNNFALMEVLGHGGMGTVYRAVDTNLAREVALKVLRKDFSGKQEFVQKLEREAKITASINHPHVVKVYSSGTAHGQFYLAMECVDRGSLDDLMQLQKRIAEIQVLDVGIQITQGLEAAYQRGLIHSDVKPGNILFADARTSKIVDFGLATLLEDEAEAKGEVWGTPYYVSPERLNREQEDFRSDMYSLGATLFHAIAGRPPFEDQTASLVALRHIRSRAVSLQAFAPDVSSETAYVVNRMLKKEREDRYASYAELIEHLRYARSRVEDGAARPQQRARVVVEDEESQRFTGWITLAMVGLALVVALIFALNFKRLTGSGKERPAPGASGPGKPPSLIDPVRGTYEEGRQLLASGDSFGALAKFEAVQRSGALSQPLGVWVSAHRGLSHLLGGDLKTAGTVFNGIANAGPYSKDPSDLPLAQFLVDLGLLVADEKAILKTAAKIYDKNGFEAFALLTLGLKDWNLGVFDDAAVLLEEYTTAEPKPPHDWIANYKPVARRYLQDYRAYRAALDAVGPSGRPKDLNLALSRIRDAKMNLSMRGRLATELDAIEKRLRSDGTLATATAVASTTAATPEPPKPKPVDKAKDAEGFQKLLASYRAKVPLYQFAGVSAEANAFVPGDPDSKRLADAVRKKAAWLAEFKSRLIGDLGAKGYAKPLLRSSGAPLPGNLTQASEAEIRIKLPYGVAPVAWNELALRSVLDMAKEFNAKSPAGEQARRQWLLGVFAYEMGQTDEGRKLLLDASQKSDEFREELELFFAVAQAGD